MIGMLINEAVENQIIPCILKRTAKFRGSYLALLEKAVNSTYGGYQFFRASPILGRCCGSSFKRGPRICKTNNVAEICDSVRLRVNSMYFWDAHGMIDFYEFGILLILMSGKKFPDSSIAACLGINGHSAKVGH